MSGSEITIGERIKKEREWKGLSQRKLGEKVGLKHTDICRIEKNKKDPKYSNLLRISRVLGVDLHEELAPNSRLDKEIKEAMKEVDEDIVDSLRKNLTCVQARKNLLLAIKHLRKELKSGAQN